MNPVLSGTVSRIAALALLAGVIGALYAFAVQPLVAEYGNAERRIAEASEQIGRASCRERV